ncbi:hypothetical protein P8936_16530 [Edaphobacter paludis]|uniref:DNA transfer protein p32 n=1 Tax=Edaphobacter paludis TaxID=3035702 RepID=A0AAU7D827_9BACT
MSGAITATTLAAVGIGAAGSVASGLISANGAENAASTQAAAANQAQTLQAQESQNALDFQKQQYSTSQAQQAPYLAAGNAGLNALQYGLGTGGTANGSGVAQGSLTTPYSGTFTAPTGLTEQNDPGYQARLQLGQDAIQRSAAARGGVVTGGTAQSLNNEAQDYASNEYGNVYNRALNTYDTNYNAYNTNQTNQYNKLASLSGVGQQTATNLANQGQSASNNVSSNLLTTGAQQGQDLQNAGAATASGYVGAANAYSGALNGIGNNLSNLGLLSQLGSASGYGSGMSTVPGASMSMYNNSI